MAGDIAQGLLHDKQEVVARFGRDRPVGDLVGQVHAAADVGGVKELDDEMRPQQIEMEKLLRLAERGLPPE